MSRAGGLLAAAVVVVGGAVAVALYQAGTPGEARLEKLDEQRVEDLRQLAQALEARRPYAPAVSESLFRAVVAVAPRDGRDAVTGRPYGFRVLPHDRYELGARFDRDTRRESQNDMERAWGHAAGDWWYAFGRGGAFLPDSGHPGP